MSWTEVSHLPNKPLGPHDSLEPKVSAFLQDAEGVCRTLSQIILLLFPSLSQRDRYKIHLKTKQTHYTTVGDIFPQCPLLLSV